MDQNQQASKPEETTSNPAAPKSASSQNASTPVVPETAKEAPKPEHMSTTAPSQATSFAGQTPPPMKPKRGSYLSGKTTALILVLAAVALFFLFLAITPQTPKQEPQTQANALTPIVQTVLALEPISSTTSATATKKVDVTIDTGKNGVNVVQLELAYDPTVITNVTVLPGTFFKNPVELTKSIDSKNGRISYALGISPSDKPVYGTGVLATLSFQFIPTASVSSTTISFLPKTLVGATGMNSSALKSAKPLQLTVPVTPTLPKATPLQTASPSPVISK